MENKLKPLIPTLKEKTRYLVYEIISENKFSFEEAKKMIDKQNQEFLGQLGMAKAGIMHVKDCYKENKGVLRINNKFLNELKMSLSLIKEINGKKLIVNCIGVSGILKKAKQKYIKGG